MVRCAMKSKNIDIYRACVILRPFCLIRMSVSGIWGKVKRPFLIPIDLFSAQFFRNDLLRADMIKCGHPDYLQAQTIGNFSCPEGQF